MAFLLILLAHWVGDFVFQTSGMAINKSHSMKWLTVHTLTYTAVLSIFSLFVFDLKVAILYVIINCVLHGITDLITSKVAVLYKNQPRIFFPIIGFDQMVHAVTLYATYLKVSDWLTWQ